MALTEQAWHSEAVGTWGPHAQLVGCEVGRPLWAQFSGSSKHYTWQCHLWVSLYRNWTRGREQTRYRTCSAVLLKDHLGNNLHVHQWWTDRQNVPLMQWLLSSLTRRAIPTSATMWMGPEDTVLRGVNPSQKDRPSWLHPSAPRDLGPWLLCVLHGVAESLQLGRGPSTWWGRRWHGWLGGS